MNKKLDMKQIESLCKPIVEVLNNYCPYTKVIISMDSIKVETTEISIPIKIND